MKKFIILFIIMLIISTMGFTQKSIEINSPNGGEVWLRGSVHSITWNSTNLTNQVKITLWKNGVFKGLIIKDQPANGIYNWTAGKYQGGTAVYGSDYKIKIREQGGTEYTTEDMSDGNFRIKSSIELNPEVFKKKKKTLPKFGDMFKPKITSALPIPLGALKAGSKLLLKGKSFGTKKGKILMYGDFANNPIELVNVQWVSDSRISGYIPQSANGHKNQLVKIIVKTSFNLKSKPWEGISFKGREEKWVHPQDVVVIKCGDDGNLNHCNHNNIPTEMQQDAIVGTHRNSIGTIGDDKGDDVYHIELKNGWIFKRLETTAWTKSSSDEMLSGPNPPFPTGQTTWTPVFSWLVSPHDYINYRMKIYVEGPIGTHYK